MFLHSIPKICCVADVELSVELASQNVNIIHISSYSGALNYVEFRAAMHPTWCMAEREGFEPSIP